MSSNIGGLNDDTVQLEDANASWQPIYVSIAITIVEGVFFLVVFECARRNKFVESVYDRRREVYAKRMPPPLRKRSGPLNGWLGFEWWRFRLADTEYRKLCVEEARKEQEQRRLAQNDTKKWNDDPYLEKAERVCFRESPFFDPCQDDDREIEDMEAMSSTSTEHDIGCESCDKKQCEDFCADKLGDGMLTKDETIPESLSEFGEGHQLKSKKEKNTKLGSILRTHICASKSVDSTSIKSSLRVRFKNRMRKSVKSAQSNDGDITIGTEEANRLARLRFSQERTSSDWDRRAIYALLKFIKRRVLLIQDKEPRTGERQDYLSEEIARRPLSAEDQELLRCVGLDAFMTLRFLLFGFHASLWPLFISLPLLLPLYQTGNGQASSGFYSTTIMAVESGSWRFWIVMALLYMQFLYILRRLWTEWELFLPLRYDFLENGDFSQENYKKQYRETALVEYVPTLQRHDKALHAFFDDIFPGQIKHAEVLLNNEHLRKLIQTRLKHIVAYENVYAKKVHKLANYFRYIDESNKSGVVKRCCLVTKHPHEPKEPMTIVVREETRHNHGNKVLDRTPVNGTVQDTRTYPALQYHYEIIQQLNHEIDSEYIRLAQEQRREIPKKKKPSLARKLGWNYLTGSDNDDVHSSTAFVEFRSLTTKQQAIQCNMVGTKKRMILTPVPEVRDIIWGNEHVSRALIVTRMMWASVLLTGGLLLWSFLVSVIRGYNEYSDWFNAQNVSVVALLNVYLPALLVEALVRTVPFLIKLLCEWVRFKSASETDHFILRWYFAFRLFTFIFVIIGNDLVAQSDDLIDDPVGWLLEVSEKVASSSQFFICYVIITAALLLLRLSQIHNVVAFFYLHNIVREESLSQRRLDKLRTNMKIFHKDEFIPLFVFVFMVGALYGVIAPLSGIFVTGFFLLAYKVVRYMALYIYGNKYEGGGFLFYTLSTILFWVLYLIILVLAGYLFAHESPATGGIFLSLLLITFYVHFYIHLTFVEPSRTLSLAKAREFDKKHDGRTPYEQKLGAWMSAKQALDEEEEKIADDSDEEYQKQLSQTSVSNAIIDVGPSLEFSDDHHLTESEKRQKAVDWLQRRYEEKNGDGCSDLTDSEISTPNGDFFIYRQPSLNRATWEVEPRPYRKCVDLNATLD